MKKYCSEAFEAMHEDFLAFFRDGDISEAELREFEADAFIDDDETLQEENPVIAEHEIA